MLAIGLLTIFTNRASTMSRTLGNAAVYGAFLVAGSLLARPAHEHLAVSTAWFSLAVVVIFVATWGQNLILHAVYVRVLAGVRIERQIAGAWRPCCPRTSRSPARLPSSSTSWRTSALRSSPSLASS